jgi:adenylate cyclase
MAQTRRLAAILAADVVGYSRLMGEDEAGTAKAVREHREAAAPIVREFGGRLVKTTGDGVLLEFPSVVAAVECAIVIQKQMTERNAGVPEDKRILYRMGVNLGDVLIEGDDILGDGVNIAARLESIAEPGGICISGSAYDQVRGRIEAEFHDLGNKALKNIAEPVRVFSLEVGEPAVSKTKKSAALKHGSTSRFAVLGAGALALALVVAGAWYSFGPNPSKVPATNVPARPEPVQLSIVVLPFTNLSGDPSLDSFADGITENLTTELSRYSFFVIARNTAFTFKGKNVDAKALGRELGVRYVLEGSMQREQNRIRLNAQLIDAETGAHLWADRFEDELSDLLKLQDKLVAQVLNEMVPGLYKADAEKATRLKSADALSLSERGWVLLFQDGSIEEQRNNNNTARDLFEQALKVDPNNERAVSGNAWTYFIEYLSGWEKAGTDYDAKILRQADRAIALNPRVWRGHFIKGWYLVLLGRPDEAIRAVNVGLSISPNVAVLYTVRAGGEISLGLLEQAKSDLQQAMRLAPRDPGAAGWQGLFGDVELAGGHAEAAIAEYQKSFDLGNRHFWIYTNLAAAYSLAGRMEEAKSNLAEGRRLNPALTIKWVKGHAEDIPIRLDALRKAGLPEE